MTDQDLRNRLAELLLQGLEVGTGKHEEGVVDEVFRAFGLNWNDIDAAVSPKKLNRAEVLQKSAAAQLAKAAPSAEDLLNAVVRCGGRFVSMLDEVFTRLAQHSTSTSGTSDTFRLKRSGVDESSLTISPGFLERVHHLMEVLQHIPVGVMDEQALKSFTRWDNGVSYGRWPINDDHDDRLVNAVLDLAWVGPLVRQRAEADPGWTPALILWNQAHEAAALLTNAAEGLVRSHAAHLDMLAGLDIAEAAREVFGDGVADRQENYLLEEIERFRAERTFWITACPGLVLTIDQVSTIGLGDDLEVSKRPAEHYYYGSGVSDLAGFVAMRKLQIWAENQRPETEQRIFQDPAALEDWLSWVASSCQEATAWLENDVLEATSEIDFSKRIEAIEEFLNLPLWKQRDLLYEVWLLCATLDACEDAAWEVELSLLPSVDGAWVLSVGPANSPVARIHMGTDKTVILDVWREPMRTADSGILTPDLAISTPPPYVRDLFVVEAKDRIKMTVGKPLEADASLDQTKLGRKTALGVAQRYAIGLHPIATWICNHCDFRQDSDPCHNHGDAWTSIHLADQFRPGHVPEGFKQSLRIALSPAPGTMAGPATEPSQIPGLVLVVDVTGSMHSRIDSAFSTFGNVEAFPFKEFRVVLFSDHGQNEPFLVRKLGPFPAMTQLADSIGVQPRGSGGDIDEALEDAMQRCKEIVEDIGPQTVLVLTDAPPHSAVACPYQIDFSAEVQALLAFGCRILVANDWLDPNNRTWSGFVDHPDFRLAPLADLVAGWKRQ
ncbi:hypothetical protein GCM10009715_22380 [Paeniglutamicibacter psychrophenolicus]|uniref:VWA domain-containing protein n=1 Tax=Paeniglutamicibacter psychrophenolicus TaxID=257454 RepID=A0ABS4WHJ8_9MICC|nr:vWA domain-containing protein [Paeniglutamicibacter psychrophenolicus]MBP2375673.1 hypothetical protein [Paeniglutamicibacter psychrophenolicus]